MSQTAKKTAIFSLIFSLLFLDLTLPVAQAEMIASETAFALARQEQQPVRGRLLGLLDRQDVQQALIAQGVNPDEARQRVAALSADELRQIAPVIDRLPAGGDGIGVIIGAAVLIFVILLITDIAGFTHVFNFVNHSR